MLNIKNAATEAVLMEHIAATKVGLVHARQIVSVGGKETQLERGS